MRRPEVGDVIGLNGWGTARVIGVRRVGRWKDTEVELETGQVGLFSDAWIHAIPDEEAEDGYRVIMRHGEPEPRSSNCGPDSV